jgi:hypothetical protein
MQFWCQQLRETRNFGFSHACARKKALPQKTFEEELFQPHIKEKCTSHHAVLVPTAL